MSNLAFLLSHLFFLYFWIRVVNSETGRTLIDIFPESKTNVYVGVILNSNSPVGSMAKAYIPMAISDFYASHQHYKTRLFLHHRNSDDVLGAAFTALDLINNEEVDAILGPQTSTQARFVIDVGDKAQVPIISFSATSPSLSTTQSPFFIRTALSDSSQAKAMAALVQAFEWREVVVVHENTEYGTALIPYLADEFQQYDIRITSRFSINPNTSKLRILEILTKLMALQTKVILVHMVPSLGSKLFSLAKKANMISEGYAWILTDGLSSLMDPMGGTVINSMNGVLGVRPYVAESERLKRFKRKWESEIESQSEKLNVFGFWAYDSVWALAKAVEMVKSSNFVQHNGRNTSKQNFPDIRISKVGRMIRNRLLKTKFQGLTGDFHLVKRQLQSSAFEIINVVDNEEIVIGYWNSENGLTSEPVKPAGNSTYSTSMYELNPPIWPGNTRVIPRGWSTPVNGKKLRIGVPVKPGFDAYMKVERDPYTNVSIVTGFSHDVFLEALKLLPFAVPLKLIPFPIGANTYNQLLCQLKLQNFDAAVGDITILANRSRYVDFTLPYLQSHVAMVVKIKDDPRKNMWIFLKPLSWDLWLTIGAAFIGTGFVVWVLEHRINNEFRGPPQQQVGTVFWFSFSILVFAHREKIMNNLARFVLIIWIFVVLILTQSYTASLASMLTVQRLQPTVVDITELKKNGDFVGYETGSFVKDFLLTQLFFDESKLKNYGTAEEFDEALTKGSKNGGVAAIFGAQHCVELFLAKYCHKYMVTGPTYKTDGLGFAFQRGSPLVTYISRAILSVTEDKAKMDAMEQKYFSQQNACEDEDQRTSISYDSLGVYSFGGLFIISGVVSVSSLIFYIVRFLQSHWTTLDETMNEDDPSIWSKVNELIKRFDLQSPYLERDVKTTTLESVQALSGVEDSPMSSSDTSNDEANNVVVDNSPTHCSSNE